MNAHKMDVLSESFIAYISHTLTWSLKSAIYSLHAWSLQLSLDMVAFYAVAGEETKDGRKRRERGKRPKFAVLDTVMCRALPINDVTANLPEVRCDFPCSHDFQQQARYLGELPVDSFTPPAWSCTPNTADSADVSINFQAPTSINAAILGLMHSHATRNNFPLPGGDRRFLTICLPPGSRLFCPPDPGPALSTFGSCCALSYRRDGVYERMLVTALTESKGAHKRVAALYG